MFLAVIRVMAPPFTARDRAGRSCGGVGFLIAAPHLILVYRYLNQSAAGALRSEFHPLFYSAHTLLEFFTPAFFGTSSPEHRWASNVGGYFGLISFLLAVSWIVARPREALRNPFVWMFAGSLALIYAVPPFVWILNVPYLDAIFPPKFWAPGHIRRSDGRGYRSRGLSKRRFQIPHTDGSGHPFCCCDGRRAMALPRIHQRLN
jgi:hypothetical protein